MSNKKQKLMVDGFRDIPKTDKTIWSTDQFGKRKVTDLDNFIVLNKLVIIFCRPVNFF